jgi:putative membrane protein
MPHYAGQACRLVTIVAFQKEQCMKTSVSLSLTVLAAAALAGCATHQVEMGAPAAVVTPAPATVVVTPAVNLSPADMHFVALAAGAGMYEVDAARIALSRASNPQVRSFAQMLLDQHTANNQQLISIVQAKGHRIAPGLPSELQQKVSKLSTLSGSAFDEEFVRTTGVADHKAAIAAFEQGDRSVTDRDLQAYIDKTLPALRSHLQMAQDLAGRMAG